MKKVFYIIGITIVAISIIVISIGISLQPKNESNVTYQFSFVPNGDSPQNFSILLKGDLFSYNADFNLQGTIHNTGISSYYTWDYIGSKVIEVPQDQEIQIIINPHGNVLGSISVDLRKL